jgi:trigger factor
MSVVVSVEDTGACRKQLTIEVPPEEVESTTRSIVGRYAKSARIPGFRPGKVPAHLVRKRFGEDIDRDVVEALVPRYWERAREEQGIDPLGQPRLTDVGAVTSGEPLRFVAVVEVRPAVELGELDGFELPDSPSAATDEEVEEAIEDLRRQAGEWKDAERPAARGDLAVLRIREDPRAGTPSAEGAEAEQGAETAETAAYPPAADEDPSAAADAAEPAAADPPAADPPATTWQSIEIEVGEPRVWEELSLAVTGLAAGQRTRFTRRPEEGSEAEPRSFELEIEAVREREPAPLDDDFAKKVGDFADVTALRQAVVDNLARGKRQERFGRRREALLEQLRGRYPLALPQGVVDSEVEGMVREFAHDLAHRGIDPRQAQVDWDKLAGELRGPAERRVHERLLLDAVAEREGVTATAEEAEALIAAISQAERAPVERVREALGGPEGIAARLRRDKAVRHLLGEEEEPPAAAEISTLTDTEATTVASEG